MKTVFAINAVVLAVGLAGCAVGPDYHRPEPLPNQPLPNNFGDHTSIQTNQGIWKIAEPSAHLARGEWWQIYGSSELDRLETLGAKLCVVLGDPGYYVRFGFEADPALTYPAGDPSGRGPAPPP